MQATPLLSRHLDAMLAGVPDLARRVMDSTLQRLREPGATIAMAPDRQQVFELLEALLVFLPHLTHAFAEAIQTEMAAARLPVVPMRSAGPIRIEDLTLVDEDQAERDIEISRTIQLIDLKAEWELRELQALTATLVGETKLRLEANPCRPAIYAKALAQAAHGLEVSNASVGLLLRMAGFALADELREVYAQACGRLKAWGVKPLDYRTVVHPRPAPLVDVTQPGAWSDLRRRMPDRAAEPPQAQSAELLSRLFTQIVADPRLEESVKHALGRLQASVMQLELQDPSLLSSGQHPTWSLLNQIAAHAGDHPTSTDPRGTDFMAFVQPLIDRLASLQPPSTASYEGALSDIQAFIEHEQEAQLAQSEPAVRAMAQAEQRQALMPLLRQQVAQQLNTADNLSLTLRAFLSGPWTEVLVRTMVSQEGADDHATQALVGTVDELLWSLQRPPTEADRSQLRERLPGLIDRLQRGMALIELPQGERDQVLDELMQIHSRHLRATPKALTPAASATPEPPRPQAPSSTAPAPDSPQALVQKMRDEVLLTESEDDVWSIDTSVGALATVPMGLDDGGAEPGAGADAVTTWLASLHKGARCKLFLQGQWITAKLLWRSDSGQFFMFTSPLAGGMHSMTRRALERLRAEGLATQVAEPSLMQRAVNSVLQDLNGLNP
ncbi:MAG: DUF1631 family protein [Pseudomonadota bacterium]